MALRSSACGRTPRSQVVRSEHLRGAPLALASRATEKRAGTCASVARSGDCRSDAMTEHGYSEGVAEHAAAVVDVGGERSVAGDAARSDLGEAAAVEQVAVVHQLWVDGVDGDLAAVVDAADPGLGRPGGRDTPAAAGAAGWAPRSPTAAARTAADTDPASPAPPTRPPDPPSADGGPFDRSADPNANNTTATPSSSVTTPSSCKYACPRSRRPVQIDPRTWPATISRPEQRLNTRERQSRELAARSRSAAPAVAERPSRRGDGGRQGEAAVRRRHPSKVTFRPLQQRWPPPDDTTALWPEPSRAAAALDVSEGASSGDERISAA